MPQEFNYQQALKIAVETEKGLICFYRRAAEIVADEGAKAFFNRLATEKEEHAGQFFQYYKGHDLGSLDEFVNQPCTLNAIEAALREGAHILHLIAHGAHRPQRETRDEAFAQ